MSTGDQADIARRLKQILPPSWFPDPAPNLWAFLQGFSNVAAWLYSLVAFARLQTRISTASGFFLDLMSFDFFGRNFPRSPALETDLAFSTGIKKELLRVRATRAGLIQALVDLTGRAPLVFEPQNASDTGGYGVDLGYDLRGGYGSMLMPYQALVTAYRPSSSGIPGVAGYGFAYGGYGLGAIEWGDVSYIIGAVTDAQIYARIASVTPQGVVAWTRLSS